MKVLIQRVLSANVKVGNEIKGKCAKGYLLFVGITHTDNKKIVDQMVDKVLNLRINEDEFGKTNLSIISKGGEILSISQFTLYACCSEGRRPSFINAAKPDYANELYIYFNQKIREHGFHVEEGIFGADMKVELINDGPFTILLDSDELKMKGE